MRITYSIFLTAAVTAGLFLLSPVSTALGKEVPRITKEELKPILNDADVVVIDVRKGRDWRSSEFKIQGAVHGDPKKIADWKGNFSKDKKLVLYCA